jgi:hypothetical protein
MRLRKTPEERRARRAERRRGRVTEKQGTQQEADELEEDLGYPVAGAFRPRERDITIFPGADDSVREHEFVHSEQYGPLRALLDAPRVQDPATRKAARGITRRMSQEVYDNLILPPSDVDPSASFYAKRKNEFSPLKYMIDTPIEFEAIVRAGTNSPYVKDIDFNQDFDTIVADLFALPENQTDTNVRLLRSSMAEANLDDRQKDLFLRSIRSNLRP